ncbi:MAG: tetratricopeptide (TPR) repeat protein, partial [Myxococcota bacterium]
MWRHPHVLTALALLTLTAGACPADAAPPQGATSELIEQARTQLKENDADSAIATLQSALRSAGNSALVHNELGVAYFQKKKYEAAAGEFGQATKLDAKFSAAWANLAETQRLLKKYKHAAVAFHRFLQQNKGDRYAIYGLGLSFEGYGRFDKALRTLQVAEQAAEGDDRLLARINVAFRRVRRKVAQAKMPLLERGDAHLTAGRWAEALGLYEQGLKKAPKDAQLLGRRGLVRAIIGQLPKARADLEAALIIDATEPVARAAYSLVIDGLVGPQAPSTPAASGSNALKSGAAARAFRSFAARLAKEPETNEALLGRGEAGLQLGAIDGAEQDFHAAAGKPGAAGLAEIHWLRGAEAPAKEAAARADGPSVDGAL